MTTARLFLAAISSALLLWTAFYPLNLGPVAFVALVPFLTLVRAEGVSRLSRYSAAFVGGLTFAVIAFNWVRVAHPMMALFAWPGISLYYALYWPLMLAMLRLLDQHGQRIGIPTVTHEADAQANPKPSFAITLPIVVVALEYFRAHFPTGFPILSYLGMHQFVGVGWYGLGYTQHGFIPLIQIADLGGIYLVSLTVAMVNGMAYHWFVRSRWFCGLYAARPDWRGRGLYPEMRITSMVVAVLAVLLCYGGYRLMHGPFDLGPQVAILQGSLPQDEKILRGELKDGLTPLEQEYYPLVRQAIQPIGSQTAPDLVVWPETSFPDNWYKIADTADAAAAPEKARRYAEISQKNFAYLNGQLWRVYSLFGLNSVVWDGEKEHKYNSALLVDPAGVVVGRYDKTHLVPFGEYVPFRDWLPGLQKLTPYEHDYSCTPGHGFPLLQIEARNGKTYRFGVLICYEDSDPYLARQYNPDAHAEGGADFLVNMSNDGWFDGTEEHEQHFAIAKFRAVEARRSLVRAVNMGVSGIIDSDGRIVMLPRETTSASVKVSGVVRDRVPIDYRGSVYALIGDWVAAVCWLVFAAVAVSAWLARYRQRRAQPA